MFTLLPLLTGEGRAHHGEILGNAAELIKAGKLVPRLDPRMFKIGKTEAAHDAVAAGSTAGKVVVSID